MKKNIRISEELKNLIEDFLFARAQSMGYNEKAEVLRARVISANRKENKLNIFWVYDENGKVNKVYWFEGLSNKEREVLKERNRINLLKLKQTCISGESF